MKDSDKRKIVSFVGLPVHTITDELNVVVPKNCSCGFNADKDPGAVNAYTHIDFELIDPTTCCGMAKVWPEFVKSKHYIPFIDWLNRRNNWPFGLKGTLELAINTPRFAQVILGYVEYVEERKGE